METRVLKNFYGKIIGKLEETDDAIIAKDFYGKILGRYDKKTKRTKDFYGKILATGDITSSLVYQAWVAHEQEIANRSK